MDERANPTEDVWTVQRILLWTTDYLKQKGVEAARLEAELLLAHARNCPRIRLYTDFETPLTDAERTRMRDYVQRRAKRQPLAYITGHKEFYGRDFQVGPGVLIPRPETETLIDVCLEHIPADKPSRVLEVGFGSGCIAVTLACQRRHCSLTATDISPQAMEFATRNAAAHKVDDRIQLLAGDGLTPVLDDASSNKFDGLVSNPPYVREDELPGLAPEVADHEPTLALVSGSDGLDLIRRIIAQAPQVLAPDAWIALEVDPAQCDPVSELLQQTGFTDVHVVADMHQNDRIVHGRWPA